MDFRKARGHFTKSKEETLLIKKRKKEKELSKVSKRKERLAR